MATHPSLPHASTPEEFEKALGDESGLRAGARTICERHALGACSIERFGDGSVPVYAIHPAHVLKIYPPYEAAERDKESLVLQLLEGRLPIPTPLVHAVGELDGWAYLLMSRLPGESLARAWNWIPGWNRVRLARALGEALAALHAVRDPRLEAVRIDWSEFVDRQRRGCVDGQKSRGLNEGWLAQIPAFLAATPLGQALPHCLLHTEVMREHLLVREDADGWTLSGLFDFEPAMIGAPEYEFAAVGLFVSCGDPAVLREILLAYGYGEKNLDGGLSNRLMAYTLLHRYSNLPWYLRRLPPPAGASTLAELAAHWWGFRTRD